MVPLSGREVLVAAGDVGRTEAADTGVDGAGALCEGGVTVRLLRRCGGAAAAGARGVLGACCW